MRKTQEEGTIITFPPPRIKRLPISQVPLDFDEEERRIETLGRGFEIEEEEITEARRRLAWNAALALSDSVNRDPGARSGAIRFLKRYLQINLEERDTPTTLRELIDICITIAMEKLTKSDDEREAFQILAAITGVEPKDLVVLPHQLSEGYNRIKTHLEMIFGIEIYMPPAA